MKKEIKEEIYRAMDSFLVESEDLGGHQLIRTVGQLNEDRHLFVKRMEELFNIK